MTKTNRGFTLIEITVVVALIGLMLAIAVPKVRDTVLTDTLKTSVNHIVNSAGELRNDALREQVDFIFHVDIDKGLFWTYSADMTPEGKAERKEKAFRFPSGVKIADLYRFGQEKVTEGEMTIRFYKGGYVQPTVVHLSKEARSFTLVFEPFLNRVTTYDSYRDIETES